MLYLKDEETRQFHTVGTAIALGKFDGIHLGHQMLIDGLLKEKQKGRKALVFTFSTAPSEQPAGGARKSIYTPEERAYYFSRFGIDILLEYPFTKQFMMWAPEDFVSKCLVNQLGVRSVYVGEDFHFGRGRCGNVALLKSLGEQYRFDVNVLAKKTKHGKVISSTTIRDMLETHFHTANEMLGNPYFVYGPVVHGEHLGRTIGYPTMNQPIPKQKLIPAYGVYSSRVTIDGMYYMGISNLGKKPTIDGRREAGLETFILNYHGDLYGRNIQTELLYFIRPEEKFSGLEELKKQIENDISLMLEQNNNV